MLNEKQKAQLMIQAGRDDLQPNTKLGLVEARSDVMSRHCVNRKSGWMFRLQEEETYRDRAFSSDQILI